MECFIQLERFNEMTQFRENAGVVEQDHSKLHPVINVLVQNSIEWHIARYTS